jgi:hypothetical protein
MWSTGDSHGGFATGVIRRPESVNGSTANKLKLYGDINGDGRWYSTDNGDGHGRIVNLYRNVMPFTRRPRTRPPSTRSRIRRFC